MKEIYSVGPSSFLRHRKICPPSESLGPVAPRLSGALATWNCLSFPLPLSPAVASAFHSNKEAIPEVSLKLPSSRKSAPCEGRTAYGGGCALGPDDLP